MKLLSRQLRAQDVYSAARVLLAAARVLLVAGHIPLAFAQNPLAIPHVCVLTAARMSDPPRPTGECKRSGVNRPM
eukprot:CAMPEP_0181173564 /NCGR_PEP_ID=MMETSP1096-20121128/3069_1 /TAXON_ID=156174 ORGANISM="Chrysochromulina ericina, Strain CCMP281" /NCGR_SAMPLE_ID=MMETSP1096 /ASSEMBLY_ACC=CAM_ASM_000453 /LENGTH=74 /DNA_ID=CAMNT_0023261405 /DNA_START=495 /DNA_END=720 /DNA_ORIENTATION=+